MKSKTLDMKQSSSALLGQKKAPSYFTNDKVRTMHSAIKLYIFSINSLMFQKIPL